MFKYKKRLIILVFFIIILLSVYISAQEEKCAVGELDIKDEAGIINVYNSEKELIQGDFENKQKALDFVEKAKVKDLECGKINPNGEMTAKRLTKLDGKIFEDLVNVRANPDETLTGESIKLEDGNTYQNFENLRTENNNIIADSLEFTASSPSEFSVINPIDNTKINFNIPEGGSVKLINKDGLFETITSEGVKEEIISKCPGPLLYTAIEKDSTLTIQKNINSIYSFSYGALGFNSNSKKQLLTTLGSKSEAEIDPCKGFICLTLAPEAKFDHEDKLDTFYLENPDIGKDYKFCLEKSEGDGYKIKDNFNLDGQIKFLNFKKDKVYFGIDQNNEASFTTEQGIIKEFKLKNKAPSQQLIARLWPSKAFELREEKDHSYLTLLNSLPDYTFIENYEPELTSESPAFWIKDDLLYQDNKNGKLGRALPISNQEFAKLIAKLNFKKIKIDETLKQWE